VFEFYYAPCCDIDYDFGFCLLYFCQVCVCVCVLSDNQRLSKIPNSYVMCSVQTHRQLLKIVHLFPENCFIGQKERLPGVVAGVQKHPKSGGENVPFVVC